MSAFGIKLTSTVISAFIGFHQLGGQCPRPQYALLFSYAILVLVEARAAVKLRHSRLGAGAALEVRVATDRREVSTRGCGEVVVGERVKAAVAVVGRGTVAGAGLVAVARGMERAVRGG